MRAGRKHSSTRNTPVERWTGPADKPWRYHVQKGIRAVGRGRGSRSRKLALNLWKIETGRLTSQITQAKESRV